MSINVAMIALMRVRLMILLLLHWASFFIPTAAPLSHFDTIFNVRISSITSEVISGNLFGMVKVINSITTAIIAFITTLVVLVMVRTRLLMCVTSVIVCEVVVLHVVGTANAR